MIAIAKKKFAEPRWHKAFLALVPAIVRHARYSFRDLPVEARDDAVQEAVANCLVAFVRLVEQGKQDLVYPSVLARYAVAQYRAGRRVGNRWHKRDVYIGASRRLRHIGSPGEQCGGWREQLVENRATSIADLAAMRIDFPRWLDALKPRNRRIALELANGGRTQDVARKFDITEARVSQLRSELRQSWSEFQSEPTAS